MAQTKQGVKIGENAPDFSLPALNGEIIRLSDFRGKRVILFAWAPWCFSRDQLSFWQDFYLKNQKTGFAVVGISVDASGGGETRRYTDCASITFPCLIDEFGAFWDLFSFNLLPAGYFVDETGRIRYLKTNAFNISEPTTFKILEDLLAEKWSKKIPHPPEKPLLSVRQEMAQLSRQVKELGRGVDKRFRWVELMVQNGQNRKAAKEVDLLIQQFPKNIRAWHFRAILHLRDKRADLAIPCWRQILKLDPAHWIARRLLWSTENPDRFYPEISMEWQQEQLRLEELQAATPLKAKAKAR
jgi:peroxiredoxin